MPGKARRAGENEVGSEEVKGDQSAYLDGRREVAEVRKVHRLAAVKAHKLLLFLDREAVHIFGTAGASFLYSLAADGLTSLLCGESVRRGPQIREGMGGKGPETELSRGSVKIIFIHRVRGK